MRGTCKCFAGRTGADCSAVVDTGGRCAHNCSGRGLCHNGHCFCHDGFTGHDCGAEVAAMVLAAMPLESAGRAEQDAEAMAVGEGQQPLFSQQGLRTQASTAITVIAVALAAFVGGAVISAAARYAKRKLGY